MDKTLQIKPEFEQIIPPLSKEEFAQLEENILKLGKITDPIQVWKGFIVDGHQRYKILQKHPEITFTTFEMDFESEEEAIAWRCTSQLGRRNLSELHKRYLIGKQYNTEKIIGFYAGNQYTLPKKSGVGLSDPPQNNHGKRSEVAVANGVSESYVKRAACFAEGIDAAEEVHPGVKTKILSGEIEASIPELAEISKLTPDNRREAVELLFIPKDERLARAIAKQVEEAFANGVFQDDEPLTEAKPEIAPAVHKPKEIPAEVKEPPAMAKGEPTREIEQSIIHSMYGTLNMFIESINDYLARFPRLITEPKYRDQTRELIAAAKKFIIEVEGDLE